MRLEYFFLNRNLYKTNLNFKFTTYYTFQLFQSGRIEGKTNQLLDQSKKKKNLLVI